jgi:RimJ/RimL family protein N-acetyltransferase
MPKLHRAVSAPLRDALTERLAVRRLAPGDLDELVSMFADAEVWWFEYERGLTRTETEAFLDRQMRLWAAFGFGGCAVRDLRDDELLGVVGLGVPTLKHPSLPPVTVGWRFASTAWGHGYATEAATALLGQAFAGMRLDRVGCVTNADNDRSVAVARRLGMTDFARQTGLSDDGARTVTGLLMATDRQHWWSTHGEPTGTAGRRSGRRRVN